MCANMSSDLRSDQLMPHSIEAEEAVLGSVLVNPECITDVCWLKPEQFFIVRHEWIYKAMLRLKERREPLDYLTIASELEQEGKLAESGGAGYLLSLINKTPSALNVDGYGRIVERMYTRRDLIAACQDIARLAHSDETDIEEILRQSDSRLSDVIVGYASHDRRVLDARGVAGELWEQVVRWDGDKGKYRGLCTGLAPVDWLSRGFRRNKLYYMTARPGMGKSAFLARIARGFAQQGYKVLFYALEMSGFEMVARMACQIANITWEKVEDGNLSHLERERYLDAVLQVGELGIAFDETAGLTVGEYWDRTTAYEKEHGPVDIVIIDTLNCIRGIGDSDAAKMTQISRTLKTWAHDNRHQYSLISACQMNRALEAQADKRPTLRALRDSGALEEDGDIIWGLYRAGYYDKEIADNNLQIEILKGRQYGQPVGSDITLAWIGACFGLEKRDDGTRQPEPFIQASFVAESAPEHYDP